MRLAQLLGKPTAIWWDPKLHGNDYFAETLIERLRGAALVRCRLAALREVGVGPQGAGGILRGRPSSRAASRVGDKSRIFKVLKTPVPLEEHPPELQPLLGYEFFQGRSGTGKVRELNEIFGPDAEREFWLKLDDLAHDICRLLERSTAGAAGRRDRARPRLPAETTGDLKEERDAIKRDLDSTATTCCPTRPLPLSAAELEIGRARATSRAARCRSTWWAGTTASCPKGR